jgi:hypothetical protein
MICICRDPLSLGVVHRADAPCYIPEQRTWQGLTDNEIALINADYPHPQGFARAIEAKLRDKNT